MPDSQPLSFSADSIVDTVREPMLVLSADLRVRRANRSFYRTFRVTPEETVDRLVYDLGNQQWDIPWLRKLLEEVLPQDTAFDDFEVEHVFPAIGRKYMLLNARRICGKDNQTEFILLAIEDTTERRLAEEARREIESRYTSLVQNIKDHSIFMMDLDGNITTWNAEAERIIGYTEAEILGRNFSVIFTPEDLQAGMSEQELRLAREDGRAEDERWHVRKDGSRFWALGIVTPMHDAGGKLTGFSKILRDMTDRKRAEEALQEADRHKDVFLATLAHELRNPMVPLRNGLQLLRLTTEPEAREQARAMMERQLGQMVRLVDDLLDISRISRNKLELRKARIDLWAVVQSAVETARPQIEANGHTLTVTLPPSPVYLDADLTRLAQVFWNLLNNSAKYTEPGGRITLTAKLQGTEAVVTVGGHGDRDSRRGIAAPVRDVFPGGPEPGPGAGRAGHRAGPRQRADGIARRDGRGLQRRAWARAVPSWSGCRSVPACRCGKSRHRQTALRVGPRRRILVVDDNRDGASSLAMLLTVMGHDTRIAHDGLEGVELAEAFRPDLIVLDIGLPKLNGLDACRRIREQPWAKNVVIAAATGWGQDEDRRRSEEAGFDHHLVKPVDAAALGKLAANGSREKRVH